MTRKEIYKFLANTKVYVNGKSEEIQEKLFSFGYEWNAGYAVVDYTEEPFLYIEDMSLTHSSNMEYFSNHKNREITAEEILVLELTEPAYRPFKTQEECWQEMLKHEPFGWTKDKGTLKYENWSCVDKYGIDGTLFYDAYKKYTFADGTPFGIKEE